MSASWQAYEGQFINNTFPLQRCLGGSEHSAVFLTRVAGPQSAKAAIKLIPARASASLRLSLWNRVSQLSHPNLLGLFQSGRCRLGDLDLLYVVMEYAEEDLSQILPERALTTAEVRDMLEPVLEALTYVHGQGLVHSHVKPSNILATGDRLKLSSDTLFPSGESRTTWGTSDVYTAPEAATGILSPASDVWSLGVTLVEALTQRAPDWQPASSADPVVAQTLPQPFLDIARHTVNRDPKLRWTVTQIRSCLNPAALAAAAAQSVSPLAVPLSPVPAVPAARLQTPRPTPQPPVNIYSPQTQPEVMPKRTIVLPNYVVPVAAALVVIAAIVALPRILGHREETSSSASTAAVSSSSQPNAAERAARPEASRGTKPSAPTATNAAKTAERKPTPALSQPPAVSAKLRTETFPSAEPPKTSPGSSANGEVLDQVLPEASEKALATIQGRVRVTVRVHVDPAGNVSAAELENPGPSQYFADLALKASRRWEFTSPEAGGRSVPSEWLIRFEFSQSGVKAFPSQVAR